MINKSLSLIFLCCCLSFTIVAQTTVELNIQHKFEKSTFVAGQPYMDNNGRAILISNIQYYLSDIELVYDGGQTVSIDNQHFLMAGETSSYNLGTVSADIQELEKINFNLGVAAAANLNTPAAYTPGHPLAAQDMYSNSEQSYIFIAIEGMIDSDQDQIPDKPFSLRATGDQLLRQISTDAPTPSTDNSLKINLIANISNWLKDIDLELVGMQENGATENETVCDNTAYHTVFSHIATTNVTTIVSPQNHIYIDSRLSYAPTIHYKFYTLEQLDMTITNINGTYFIQRFDLNPDGDFFMDDDLASGIYIVIFTTPKGVRQSKRFVIRN